MTTAQIALATTLLAEILRLLQRGETPIVIAAAGPLDPDDVMDQVDHERHRETLPAGPPSEATYVHIPPAGRLP